MVLLLGMLKKLVSVVNWSSVILNPVRIRWWKVRRMVAVTLPRNTTFIDPRVQIVLGKHSHWS